MKRIMMKSSKFGGFSNFNRLIFPEITKVGKYNNWSFSTAYKGDLSWEVWSLNSGWGSNDELRVYFDKEEIMLLGSERKMDWDLAAYYLTDSRIFDKKEEEIAAKQDAS